MRTIGEQVVVITGASSGIGRETAIRFGERGASVVLAARNEEALQEVERKVERLGGRAHVVLTDVAEWGQVDRLAREAVNRFGRIDTWVNNAAASEYATVEETTVEEIERQIQVILVSQLYGMKAALPHMKRQGQGTIINNASGLAKRSVPLQGTYCAAKHGIKGFTDALRMELQHERSEITVTLLMPSSINTPFFGHARSKLGVKPMPIPPAYEPRAVAEAILFAAEHPRRDIVVGSAGKMLEVMERISPSLLDRLMLARGTMFEMQKTDRPDDGRDNLFEPVRETGSTTGEFGKLSRSTSLYTRHLEQHPNRKRILLGLAAAGAVALVRRARR
ncbi:MAG TPA: SDR family oxidoreductase [Rubrobacter sp.]|nr:SDR family oxidoreductase [Rubrobacter sp.]